MGTTWERMRQILLVSTGAAEGTEEMKRRMISRLLAVLLVGQSIFFGTRIYGYAAGTDVGDAGLTEADVQEQTGGGWDAGTKVPYYDVGIPGALLGTDGDMYYEVIYEAGTGTAEETKRETGTAAGAENAVENEAGACLRTLFAHGNAKGDYEAVVRIVKPGVIGEAKAAISVDGGQSWLAAFTVEDKVKISALGLKLEFSTERDTDEFEAGDTFRFTTVESFALISDHPEMAVVALTGHPLEKARPMVSILSTGPRGVSKFALRMQDGAEPVVVDTVPEDGVYEYQGLRFYFSDSTYVKGFAFSGSIVPNEETVGMGPIVAVAAGLAVLAGAGVVALNARKEKPGEYELRPWVQRQEEEVYRQG